MTTTLSEPVAQPKIYPLTVGDMKTARAVSQDRLMDGYIHLTRRGFTAFDRFTAQDAGFAIERGDWASLITQEIDAAYCERLAT